ncbi:hypothetical protein PFICI_12304 [Pestalotiopsis fici W106-1]|uniref:Major facilitator superfamily (MFS) profile domain-containing protein n=1 Tax=Pestalotiopsis fici (strain W106-1 / CGMCC3.15140) TaxID=1229662 RepID=W3WN66_PESFW|nr:uncharacterized protein PFICI_12304 [Pestalotiopsis fici W106-1]ETS75360.1 hypothetical protein PFICI_12304 [Pestalotiopsis fici W106-1]
MENEPIYEEIPFMPTNDENGSLDTPQTEERPRLRRDFLIATLPFFCLQLTWSIQQVFGIPYLYSLGISDSNVPLFLFAGPLAGLIVPPLVAAVGDSFGSPYGKRKPLIFFGGIGVIFSLLAFASISIIVEQLSYSTAAAWSDAKVTHVVAGVSLYMLNFCIQPLSLGLRASIVDYFDPDEQVAVNLWVSCFSVMGSIFVALLALIYSPAFWDLSLVVVALLLAMLIMVAVSQLYRYPILGVSEPVQRSMSIRSRLSHTLKTARDLPPITRWTCAVQLRSWFAWFLVLHYTSVLVSRAYEDHNTLMAASQQSATAIAWTALLFHCTSLLSLVLVSLTREDSSYHLLSSKTNGEDDEIGDAVFTIEDDSDPETEADEADVRRASLHITTTSHVASNHDNRQDVTTNLLQPIQIEKYKESHGTKTLETTRQTLWREIWRPSLLGLAISLVATIVTNLFPKSTSTALMTSLFLGSNGLLFSLANWVPYTLIAYEAAVRARARTANSPRPNQNQNPANHEKDGPSNDQAPGNEDENPDTECDDDHSTPRLLAVHNMSITVPQIMALVVVWLLDQGLDALGMVPDVLWTFVLCVPALIWAICQ